MLIWSGSTQATGGQADIYKRQGIQLDRGTLGNWVGRAAFHLKS